MKQHKNRSKSVFADHSEIVFEEEIHELADALTETQNTSDVVPMMTDPFEDYMDSMRTKVYTNPHLFRSRLAKGYHALLHELEHPDNISK